MRTREHMKNFRVAAERFAQSVDAKHQFPTGYTLIETRQLTRSFREHQDPKMTEQHVLAAIKMMNEALTHGDGSRLDMNAP